MSSPARRQPQINRVVPSRNLHTIREMVESFDSRGAGLPALSMKKDGAYWTLSYAELAERVRALAAGLRRLGAAKGSRVGLISENRSEWVISYLAVASSGSVIVPYDILLKVEELASIMRASEARIILTSAEYLEKVKNAAGEGARIVVFDPSPAQTDVPFLELLEQGRTSIREGGNPFADPVRPDDLAALIFTSGTTGAPKGVMLSHRNLVENGDGVQQTTPLGPGDNWIIVLPYHHTYPTAMGIFTPLLTGGRITTVPSLKTNILIETMKETGATCIPAMPLLIERIYKGILSKVKSKPPVVQALFKAMLAVSGFFFKTLGIRIGKLLFGSVARELGLQRLRFFISGGGPIAKDVIDGMESLGLTTHQGYGLTETSPVISSTCPAHNKPGSVGLPLANVEVRIDAPDANGNGEILARGSNVMLGYLDMPEKTREVIDADGWLHTGDIGKLDEDGYLFITGRLKNIIVTKGGKNIYPEEIENMLLASTLISEVVVLGKLDKDGGEYPFAVVYPDPEAVKNLDEAHVRKLIQAEIRTCMAGAAPYKVPLGFDISTEELPKTSTRKVKRFMFAGPRAPENRTL
jgi:long-chain acyl-CoA synthetase